MANKKTKQVKSEKKQGMHLPSFPSLPTQPIGAFADEIARMVVERLPQMAGGKPKKKASKSKKAENALFLDTSAIIDGRIFDVVNAGLVWGEIVVPESILLELKHIADSQDLVKRERGRRGLLALEKLKKTRGVHVLILSDGNGSAEKRSTMEVDEILIKCTKTHKGRVVTCDYNLEKKAKIQGVTAVNMNAIANMLKVTAVPGESIHTKIVHVGKEATQGVGYLDDGTMIVVEEGSEDIGKMVNIVISRVIQTDAGRILFAKKI